MFFAIELQISIVYVLFHLQGLGPSKRSIRYRKIALRYEYALFWCANAPHHSQLGLFDGQRVLMTFCV